MTATAQMQRARYCAARFGLIIRKVQNGGYILTDRQKIVTDKVLSFAEIQKYLIGLKINELKNYQSSQTTTENEEE